MSNINSITQQRNDLELNCNAAFKDFLHITMGNFSPEFKKAVEIRYHQASDNYTKFVIDNMPKKNKHPNSPIVTALESFARNYTFSESVREMKNTDEIAKKFIRDTMSQEGDIKFYDSIYEGFKSLYKTRE